MSAASHLATLQRTIQNRVLRGTAHSAGLVRGDDHDDAAARIGIYATAYRLRLIEALGANYPLLNAHLGDDAFVALAREHIDTHPSSFVSIRTFGVHLPRWLESSRPTEPWLAEFAQLEWALGCAFDAPDAKCVGMDALMSLSPDEWSMLALRFGAPVRRLTLHTNAADLYAAAANDRSAPAGVRLHEPGEWLVFRHALQAQYRALARDEALAFDSLFAGGTFAQACERLADILDEDAVPTAAVAFLKRWLLDEHVVGIEIRP